MPFIKEEGGLINNFAPETKTYEAEPPSATQKRNYVLLGMAALILISGLMFVAYSASNVSWLKNAIAAGQDPLESQGLTA